MIRWLALVLVACSGGTESPEPIAPTTAEPTPTPLEENEETVSPWPSDLVDLRASTEHFRDRESCETELRERVPVEVAEALSDLAYDSVVRDVCIGLDAAKQADPNVCAELSVRAAQDGCLRRTAILAGLPDACPNARGLAGRDPECLAFALRDPRLCAGVLRSERRSCRAVLANDADRCRGELCRARVGRYGPVLETDARGGVIATHATLTLRRPDAPDETHAYEAAADRGVFLRAGSTSHRIEFELGERFREEPRISLDATLASTPTVHVARLMMPGGANEGDLSEATLVLEEGERQRGATLKGTLRGAFREGANQTEVTLEFETWIRDLDPISPSTPPPGT